jgi:hypothetical protein
MPVGRPALLHVERGGDSSSLEEDALLRGPLGWRDARGAADQCHPERRSQPGRACADTDVAASRSRRGWLRDRRRRRRQRVGFRYWCRRARFRTRVRTWRPDLVRHITLLQTQCRSRVFGHSRERTERGSCAGCSTGPFSAASCSGRPRPDRLQGRRHHGEAPPRAMVPYPGVHRRYNPGRMSSARRLWIHRMSISRGVLRSTRAARQSNRTARGPRHPAESRPNRYRALAPASNKFATSAASGTAPASSRPPQCRRRRSSDCLAR